MEKVWDFPILSMKKCGKCPLFRRQVIPGRGQQEHFYGMAIDSFWNNLKFSNLHIIEFSFLSVFLKMWCIHKCEFGSFFFFKDQNMINRN